MGKGVAVGKERSSSNISHLGWVHQAQYPYPELRVFLNKHSQIQKDIFWTDKPETLSCKSEEQYQTGKKQSEHLGPLWLPVGCPLWSHKATVALQGSNPRRGSAIGAGSSSTRQPVSPSLCPPQATVFRIESLGTGTIFMRI